MISERMPEWRSRYPGVETLNFAVMGCIVNGPGESKQADIGISLPGTGEAPAAPVFVDGKKMTTLRGPNIAAEFQQIVEDYIERRFGGSAASSRSGSGDTKDIRPEARPQPIGEPTMTSNNPAPRLAAPLRSAALLLVLAGCSGSSLPDTDRVFLSAAGGWDRNRDGVVTCDEWKAYATELFNGADANRDGSLDRTEYAKLISTDRMFQTVEFGYYDANGDGKVERTEFVDKPNRAFALLDKNNECKLTRTRPPARAPIPSRSSIPRRRSRAIRARRKRAAPASAGCERLLYLA